jgi:DNA-binding transcriptional MerR regulator
VRDHGVVITIGQLARYAGVTTKTIRVYHDKGLLAEPDRDASGYRRYTAQEAIDLIKVRTLAEAGVPLARIRALKAAPDEGFQRALTEIDGDLTARIRSLRHTQRRLRELASGQTRLLPAEVDHHLQRLRELGFSGRWVMLESDLWILVFATHPDIAHVLFRDQAQAVTDPTLRQIYLDYDRAHDLDPLDPSLPTSLHASSTRPDSDTEPVISPDKRPARTSRSLSKALSTPHPPPGNSWTR